MKFDWMTISAGQSFWPPAHDGLLCDGDGTAACQFDPMGQRRCAPVRTQGVRQTGSAVLDLCYVACGLVDALWEFGPRPWDVAARALIVAEAGG